MSIEIGHVEAIFRYPAKSMRGESLVATTLGWHGIDGDRRLACRRFDARDGFPWLTATKFPDLILFTPQRREDGNDEALPTHVLTPDGDVLPMLGAVLAAEIGRRCGIAIEMMQLRHGVFDDACISVITSDTVMQVCRLSNRRADVRRVPSEYRRAVRARCSLHEDEWLGGVLTFGEADDAPAVAVTMRDVRCAMVNFDPDGGSPAPEMLKAAVRANQNNAGIYGTVTRIGRLAVGQTVVLRR